MLNFKIAKNFGLNYRLMSVLETKNTNFMDT